MISYRSYLLATGAVQRRQDETALDRGQVREALLKSEIEPLKATFDALKRLKRREDVATLRGKAVEEL